MEKFFIPQRELVLTIDVVDASYNRFKVSVQSYLCTFYDQLQEKIHDRRGTGSCP
jgi:hypothetical protein